MRRIQQLKIVGIILLILSVIFIFVGVFVPNFFNQKYDETNTIEYTATVSKVEEDLDGFKVYMKGYNSYILVEPDQLVSSDLSDLLLNISENDDIVFRVISESIIDSPYMDYFSVVALETTETEFITLESSTVILQKEILNAKIIGISVAILAFVGAVIVLGLAVKGKRKSKNG